MTVVPFFLCSDAHDFQDPEVLPVQGIQQVQLEGGGQPLPGISLDLQVAAEPPLLEQGQDRPGISVGGLQTLIIFHEQGHMVMDAPMAGRAFGKVR